VLYLVVELLLDGAELLRRKACEVNRGALAIDGWLAIHKLNH